MQTILQSHLNARCCPAIVSEYNFDVDSSDWAAVGITDQASFNSVLEVTTSAFQITGNKIRAKIITIPNGTLLLFSKNIFS